MTSTYGAYYLKDFQLINKSSFFNEAHYSYWKNRMKLFIQASDLRAWIITMKGYTTPTFEMKDWSEAYSKRFQTNAKAMHIFFCAHGPQEYGSASSCSNSKEIRDMLEVIHEGTDELKENNIDILNLKYENFKMNPMEDIKAMEGKNTKKTMKNKGKIIKKKTTKKNNKRKVVSSFSFYFSSMLFFIFIFIFAFFPYALDFGCELNMDSSCFRTYDAAAREFHGPKAKTNFPSPDEMNSYNASNNKCQNQQSPSQSSTVEESSSPTVEGGFNSSPTPLSDSNGIVAHTAFRSKPMSHHQLPTPLLAKPLVWEVQTPTRAANVHELNALHAIRAKTSESFDLGNSPRVGFSESVIWGVIKHTREACLTQVGEGNQQIYTLKKRLVWIILAFLEIINEDDNHNSVDEVCADTSTDNAVGEEVVSTIHVDASATSEEANISGSTYPTTSDNASADVLPIVLNCGCGLCCGCGRSVAVVDAADVT
ncbi:hypothetical protein GQ457_13G009800 [Hibiscus cannabinus]